MLGSQTIGTYWDMLYKHSPKFEALTGKKAGASQSQNLKP